ncbi:TRAP transporter small permease [Anaerobacillus sp. MEB173]|uniref:TRAP transporter small permease n=1 Tax=Anaerobacillus sp. MEB173 TaxID=3383345 RepID=UPI003F919F2A
MRGTKIIDRTLEAGTILCFIGIIAVVLFQVTSRFLPVSAVWTEELTRFLFLYAICFAAPLALKDKEFISVDIIMQFIPNKIKHIYEGIVYLLIVAVSAIIAFQGYHFMLIGRGQTSATMAIEMSVIHASIGISMVFICLYAIIHVFDYFKGPPKEER